MIRQGFADIRRSFRQQVRSFHFTIPNSTQHRSPVSHDTPPSSSIVQNENEIHKPSDVKSISALNIDDVTLAPPSTNDTTTTIHKENDDTLTPIPVTTNNPQQDNHPPEPVDSEPPYSPV